MLGTAHSEQPGGRPRYDRAWRHITRHNRASTYKRSLPDSYIAEDHRSTAHRSTATDARAL
jgi:hypothetical protein